MRFCLTFFRNSIIFLSVGALSVFADTPAKTKELLSEFKPVRYFAPEYQKSPKLTVVVFLGTICPISRLYAPRLDRLQKRYKAKGVQFFAVFSNYGEDRDNVDAYAGKFDFSFPAVWDASQRVADHFKAKRVPEAFVIDGTGRVVYRGRIDDQYRFDGRSARPKQTYLIDAVEQTLAKKPVAVPETDPKDAGCHLERAPVQVKDASITFTKHVAPILRSRCLSCHQSGSVKSDVPLEKYEDVLYLRNTIAERVRTRRMPPWGVDIPYSHQFKNSRLLPQAEIDTIVNWVKQGAPFGRAEELPPLPKKKHLDWIIGKPDMVVKMNAPFPVPAEGIVDYVYQEAKYAHINGKKQPLVFDQDYYLLASETLPGDPEVVHHVDVFLLPPKEKRFDLEHATFIRKGVEENGGLLSKFITAKRSNMSSENNRWSRIFYGVRGTHALNVVGVYVPGIRTNYHYPKGYAMKIPKGSKIYFEMHYTPNGEPRQDQSYIGLKLKTKAQAIKELGKEPYEVLTHPFGKLYSIIIPPNDPNYRMEKTFFFERKAAIVSLRPHMHVRGKNYQFDLIYPDGEEKTLLRVSRWDFENQSNYVFKEPLIVPSGSVLRGVAHFDNSINNPFNPDPNVEVGFGLQTHQEMFFGFVNFAYLEPPEPDDDVDAEEDTEDDPEKNDEK